MSKANVVQVHILNHTNRTLNYVTDSYREGRSANNDWPTTVAPKNEVSVTCYEKDWSAAGCDGWVNYTIDGMKVYFLFANVQRIVTIPGFITHRIEAALEPSSVQDKMRSYFDYSANRYFKLPNGREWLVVKMQNYPNNPSHAFWHLSICNPEQVIPTNLEVNDVQKTFNEVSSKGSREYYECPVPPTDVVGMGQSHFKGIGFFGDKLIFSHTNIGPGGAFGKYLIADKISKIKEGLPAATIGLVGRTHKTNDSKWKHPGGLQVCGSFMAMGLQETDESGNGSFIEIYDIRQTLVDEPAVVIGRIERSGLGINGVAMTKERGVDGRYIVAGIDGNQLTLYRSKNSFLSTKNDGSNQFEIIATKQMNISGAGIALVTQKDGRIFLFGLDSDDPGSYNKMYLYELKIEAGAKKFDAPQLGVRDMPVPGTSESISRVKFLVSQIDEAAAVIFGLLPEDIRKYYKDFKKIIDMSKSLNSSFRWGKGLKIISENSIEVYATDRNVMPIAKVNLPVLFERDPREFSLVTWR